MKENMEKLYGYYNQIKFIEISEGVFEKIFVRKEIDYKDKKVLDIGAGQDSANFFINKGARELICINKNMKELEKINTMNTKKVCLEINNIKDFYDLIRIFEPDAVKIDIEGTEMQMVISDEPEYIKVMKIPKFYIIEIHPFFNLSMDEVYDIWSYWCEKTGFKLLGYREICHNNIKNFDDVKLKIIYIEPEGLT